MKSFLNTSFAFILLSLCLVNVNADGNAHGGDNNEEQTSSISANAHFLFANKGSVAPKQPWQIPGAFMGGEAYPVEKGLNLQNIELKGTWVLKPTYTVDAKLASHHNGEVEIENFYFSFYPTEFLNTDSLYFTVGKVDARFSPTASWHAYSSSFNEAPLIAEVFFGGHFTDQGVQSLFSNKNFNAGIEVWNGSAWPASSGEYSGDIFFNITKDFNALKVTSGIWSLYSEALNRSDQRYAAGHSHGSNVVSTPSIFFSGRNLLSGAFVEINYALANNQSVGWYSEFIQQDINGEINDATRESNIDGKHYGIINQIFYKVQTLNFALRHETMSFENTFTGASANFIAEDAGLVNDDFEPNRIHFSISNDIDDFIVRAEAVSDKSVSDQGLNRFTLSVIWKDVIWSK